MQLFKTNLRVFNRIIQLEVNNLMIEVHVSKSQFHNKYLMLVYFYVTSRWLYSNYIATRTT